MADKDRDDPPKLTRRQLLTRGSFAALAAGVAGCSLPGGCQQRGDPSAPEQNPGSDGSTGSSNSDPTSDADPDLSDWSNVRAQFDVDPELVHMAGMLLASHPRPVREAIERHRRGLNDNPAEYLYEHWGRSAEQLDDDGEQEAMAAVGRYLGTSPDNIALTDSTTEGLAVVYNGIDIRDDQEVLLGYWNHWATRGSVLYASRQHGFDTRRVELSAAPGDVSAGELVDRLVDEITPQTRVVAVTWVHSTSGLKLPVGEIGRRIERINQDRRAADRVLFCVDGVHGFGVEDATMEDLHCDFFVAGCHKWLCGPRGTGIIAGRRRGWRQATPTVPTFSMELTPGRRFTPGGFKPYEHIWALAEAFEFHRQIGKPRIRDRIHELATRLIEELDEMDHVGVLTPLNPELRAGVVTFRVDGIGPYDTVEHLRRHDIVASVTPESRPVARLAPGLLNDHDEIETTLDAIRTLG